MSDIGIGVIGCGGMGLSVVKKLLAAGHQQLRVTAVYDPDERSIQNALDVLPVRPRVYSDIHQLLADPSVQWVMIASWNRFHCEQAIAALEAGKHVFCQKPLAITFDECLAMQQAWQRSGKLFHVGFNLRHAPHYRTIKEAIDAGRIGRIISLEFNETLDFNHGGYIMGNWRRLRANAGTHLLEKCCHDIDLINWIVGSVATRAASFGGLNFFRPENAEHVERLGQDKAGKPAYSTWLNLEVLNPFTSDKDIVDNQVAILEFANGMRASFHTNCQAAIPERRMYILGTEGTLRADLYSGVIELKRIGFDTTLEKLEAQGDGHNGHGGGDEILADELAHSMLHGTMPKVGLTEGLRSAVTCFALDQACDTGQVVDVRPYWEKAGIPIA